MERIINGVWREVVLVGQNQTYGDNYAPAVRYNNFNPSSDRIDAMCFPPEGTGNTFDRLESFHNLLGYNNLFNGLNSYPKSNTTDLNAVDNTTKSAIDEGYQLLVNLEHGALPANGGIFGGSGRYPLSSSSNLEEIYQSYLTKDIGIEIPEDKYYTQFYNYLLLLRGELISKNRTNLIVYLTALHEANDIIGTYIWSKGNLFSRLKATKYLMGKMIDEIFPKSDFPNIVFIDWLNRFNGGDRLWSIQNLLISKSEWEALDIKCELVTGTTIYNRAGTSSSHLYDLNFGYSAEYIFREIYNANLGTDVVIPEISTNNNLTFPSEKLKWMLDCANYLISKTPLKIRAIGSFLITIDAGGAFERSWGWKNEAERETGIASTLAIKGKKTITSPLQSIDGDNIIHNPYCVDLTPTAAPWYRLDTGGTITTPTFRTKAFTEGNYASIFRWNQSHPLETRHLEVQCDGLGNGKDAVWSGTQSNDPNATRQRIFFEIPSTMFLPVAQQVFLVAVDVIAEQEGMFMAMGVRNSTGGTFTFHKELSTITQTIWTPAILKTITAGGNLQVIFQTGHNTVNGKIWFTNFRCYQLRGLNYVDINLPSIQQMGKTTNTTWGGDKVMMASSTVISANSSQTFIWNNSKIMRNSKVIATVENSSTFAGDTVNTGGNLIIGTITTIAGSTTVSINNIGAAATNGVYSVKICLI
jgi:hypothetical protein